MSARTKELYKQLDFAALVEIAQHGERDERLSALRELAALRRRHVVEPIARLLSDEDEHIRAAAAGTLAKFGGEQAVSALLEAQPATPRTRAAVAYALGLLAARAAEPQLVGMLEDPQERVRAAAARALGRIGAGDSVAALRRRLADDDRWVRRRARHALIDIGTADAVAALAEDGRRAWPLRTLDVRAARRSLERHQRRAEGEVAAPLDSLTVRLWSGALKALVFAAVVVLVEVLVLRASLVIIVAVALIVAAPLARMMVRTEPLLDYVVPRARRRPAASRRASWRHTLGRTLTSRPLATATWLAAPLAVDAIVGGPGVAGALITGLVIAAGVSRGFDALVVSVWQDHDPGAPLLVEPDRTALRHSRFFVG